MDTDEGRAGLLRRLIAWPFFRQGRGRHRCVAAVLLAFVATAIGLLHTNLFRTPTDSLMADGHANLALEQALAWNLCGKYGGLGAHFDQVAVLPPFEVSVARERYAIGIAWRYGSLDRYCDGVRPSYLNNENSLFLLTAALLALPPDDSPTTLAAKLVAFRYALLLASLSVLAFYGVGLLPLIFLSVVAVGIVAAPQGTHLFSIYPTLAILLLFSSALIAVFSRVLATARTGRLLLAAVGLGLAFGFIYNWRTSYGPVILGQLILAVAVANLLQRGAPRRAAAFGLAAAGVAAGWLLFQSTFIWTLQRNSPPGFNAAHHPIWHPIVLGLANPPNALAEREGIRWYDPVGLTLARRIDPKAEFLGPTYEAALATYYLDLWKKHPWEMLEVYRRKLFETTRTMMSALGPLFEWPRLSAIAERLIPNGYVWVGLVSILGVLAIAAARPFPALGAFSAALVAALLLVTAEQAVTIPHAFLATYQSNLIVNFAALVAILAALAFAWTLRMAEKRHGTRAASVPAA